MILKFVFGKQIHIYDLKQEESFSHACDKIRQMFKRLPDQFVLIYRNSEQLELEIDSSQSFDQLINSIEKTAKTIKLYITDVNDRKALENEPISEEKISMQNEQKQQAQTLQQEKDQKKYEQESGQFTDLHQPQSETQNLLQSQQLKEEIEEKKEFQHLNSSDQDENQVQKEIETYLESKIQNLNFDNQRELDTNLLECSDPNQMQHLGYNKLQQKEVFQSQQDNKCGSIEEVKPVLPQQQDQIPNVNLIDFTDVQKMSPSERKKIFQPYQPKEKIQPKNIRQHNARCDKCKCYPIIGARYKCVVCQGYDLCEKCEPHFLHKHPLLKILFSHQTPISIKVQIPQFSQKGIKQQEIVLQKIDISQLDEDQRRERIFSLASELSDLLDIEFQQCTNFIRQNEAYTKQTLTQLLISRKNGNLLIKDKLCIKQNEQKGITFNDIFTNIKGAFKGIISK